jgi:TDG/mug DNA glycosylase family protein
VHDATIAIYERRAREFRDKRGVRHRERARRLAAAALPGLARADLGCGPGGHLRVIGRTAVGLDASRAMLDLAREAAPRAPLVQADLEAPPFRHRSLGAAWARNAYLHLRRERVPLALAQVQLALDVGAPLVFSCLHGERDEFISDDDFPGRFFSQWRGDDQLDVITGAGFEVAAVDEERDELWVTARRGRMLPDTVGPDMRLLVCGLNPSEVAADAGYGYAGATNRFWSAAQQAGLVGRPRDPLHALTVDRVGMTDLVKRATPRASLLRAAEYREGAARVRRLVEWLRPGAVLFVGLEGWRAAVDRRAAPGLQPEPFGSVPAYVMPSTSGLNARTSLAELVAHLRAARAAAAARRSRRR